MSAGWRTAPRPPAGLARGDHHLRAIRTTRAREIPSRDSGRTRGQASKTTRARPSPEPPGSAQEGYKDGHDERDASTTKHAERTYGFRLARTGETARSRPGPARAYPAPRAVPSAR
ncbi:hypothetical protein CERSUDRAFT_101183 [Gelatoporia subvermispora B]|uniref:Uncharacterized protein n=1 Tax=Ceriporiopsis subvermispora (strain B) TaxID=914234 RepID=M2Q1B5_CERS8|nr:hypothetical protein CERSUDRAFT_101183 [Gelatoporia subvermispora B]